MVQIHCCLTLILKSLMFKYSNNKIFSSEIVIYICDCNFFSCFFFQRGISKIPKSIQKLTINKSPHVFKKAKERFVIKKPIKIHFISPFFSQISFLKSFIKTVIPYLFYLSFTIQIKIINKVSFKLMILLILKN